MGNYEKEDSLDRVTRKVKMSATVNNLLKSTKALAEVAGKTVSSRIGQSYAQVMESNAKYVLEDKSKLADMPKQYIFTHLAEFPKYTAQATKEWTMTKAKLSSWRELSAAEAATGLIFTGELFAWFCVGEYVGRGFSLTGYSV